MKTIPVLSVVEYKEIDPVFFPVTEHGFRIDLVIFLFTVRGVAVLDLLAGSLGPITH